MEKKRAEIISRIIEFSRSDSISKDKRLPPERELAKILGVSRVSLREALVALDVMGILETKGREGSFIKELEVGLTSDTFKILPIWPENIINQFCEMRIIVEVNAAKLAATRRNDTQLKDLQECLNKLRSEINENNNHDMQAHYELMLHYMVIESSNNLLLKKMYESLTLSMEKYHNIMHRNLIRTSCWGFEILEHQQNIFEAIKQQDVILAGETMKFHLVKTFEKFYGLKKYKDFNIIN